MFTTKTGRQILCVLVPLWYAYLLVSKAKSGLARPIRALCPIRGQPVVGHPFKGGPV